MAPKKLVSMRIDDRADALLAKLSAMTGTPKSELIGAAIEDMYKARVLEECEVELAVMVNFFVDQLSGWSEGSRQAVISNVWNMVGETELPTIEGEDPQRLVMTMMVKYAEILEQVIRNL